MHVDVVMSIPKLRLTGTYGIDGKILLVPMTGDGPFQMDVSGLQIFAKAVLKENHDTRKLYVDETVRSRP